uniref:Uncharacterized protein n=1 Tax=uncultured Acidobacteriota bacterium TaxID=171953 RepID=H5S9F5_9BACT|nr:hypothetical protein HGMM_F03C01C32 [uncultured Acidobacteriota bacterium]
MDFLQEGDAPQWAILLCGWERAMCLAPVDIWKVWDRQQALRRRQVQVWLVFPLALEEVLDGLLRMTSPLRWQPEAVGPSSS